MIVINKKQFKYLSDNIYINNKKVLLVKVNGNKVYPASYWGRISFYYDFYESIVPWSYETVINRYGVYLTFSTSTRLIPSRIAFCIRRRFAAGTIDNIALPPWTYHYIDAYTSDDADGLNAIRMTAFISINDTIIPNSASSALHPQLWKGPGGQGFVRNENGYWSCVSVTPLGLWDENRTFPLTEYSHVIVTTDAGVTSVKYFIEDEQAAIDYVLNG